MKKNKNEDEKHTPACLDASDKNLRDNFYCWFCDMPWYNCLCCHDDDYEDD